MASETKILFDGPSTINGALDVKGGMSVDTFFYNDTTPLTFPAMVSGTYTPDIIEYNSATPTSVLSGTPTKLGEYYQIGDIVFCAIDITWSSIIGSLDDSIGINIPVTARTSTSPITVQMVSTCGRMEGITFNSGAGDTNEVDSSMRVVGIVKTGTYQDRLELRMSSETGYDLGKIFADIDTDAYSLQSSGNIVMSFMYQAA